MIICMVHKHDKRMSLSVYPKASRMQLQLRHMANASPHEIFLELKFSPYYDVLPANNNELLDNPTVTQVVKKFTAFYGVQSSTLYIFLFSHSRSMCPVHRMLLDLISLTIYL
jgi:hypothetical protein